MRPNAYISALALAISDFDPRTVIYSLRVRSSRRFARTAACEAEERIVDLHLDANEISRTWKYSTLTAGGIRETLRTTADLLDLNQDQHRRAFLAGERVLGGQRFDAQSIAVDSKLAHLSRARP
jgi:hypothetical protein